MKKPKCYVCKEEKGELLYSPMGRICEKCLPNLTNTMNTEENKPNKVEDWIKYCKLMGTKGGVVMPEGAVREALTSSYEQGVKDERVRIEKHLKDAQFDYGGAVDVRSAEWGEDMMRSSVLRALKNN